MSDTEKSELRDTIYDILQNNLDLRVDEGQAYAHGQEEVYEAIQALITQQCNDTTISTLAVPKDGKWHEITVQAKVEADGALRLANYRRFIVKGGESND